jgi:succinate dehydrogenase / fumarate reductase flavoprotein subunit/fumarate reductase flavoprotein subunit
MAAALALRENLRPFSESQAEEIRMRWLRPLLMDSGQDIYAMREEMKNLMWEKVGLVRTGAQMEEAVRRLNEIAQDVEQARVENGRLIRYNMEWQNIIDVTNSITVCRMVANAALRREESRGAHYREDFPELDNKGWLLNIQLSKKGERDMQLTTKPVKLTRHKTEDLENLK